MHKKENITPRVKIAAVRLCAVSLSLSALVGSALAAPATVTAQGGLRLRSSASTSAQAIATLASGSKVEVLEALNGWYRVETNNKTGYVSSEYLSVTATVSASSLNVRSTPSTSGSKVTTLSSGTQLTLLEALDGWYRIEANGKTGYVSGQYISLAAAKAPTASAPAVSAPEQSHTTGTVSASSLNVRSGPGSSYGKIGTLSSGAQVEILETQSGWYRINFNGKNGYVSSQYVTVTKTQQPAAEPQDTPQPTVQPEATPAPQPEAQPEQKTPDAKTYGMVSTSSLNVRSGPGTSYGKVKTLSGGAQVEVLEKVDGWYRIDSGYVSADYILILDGSMTALQSQIVAYAHTFLGRPYVYGGNGPNSFDCSGLTRYVYKHFGYNLNRGATSQLQNGITVSKENLQPGDLVFFNSEGSNVNRATHVGIYIGNGEFLHASNKRLGVTITSLSDPYRLRTYTTARRII